MIDPWIGNGACAVGRACTTPCSDGERIYVTTPFQDLFCLDMDGKILWQQYWGDGKMVGDRANYYPAPILVDGMVIRYRHIGSATTDLLSVRAFDKLTGKLLYTVGAPKTGGAYFIGTPQILTVDGVRLLALSDGRIIRASNGEVLMEETISYSAHGRSDLGFGNWLWTVNGHEGGGYGGDRRQMKNMEIMAHQFSWSDAMKTKLEHKVVWRCDGTGNMIGYYQGLLFHTVGRDTIGTRDAFTGAPKATGKKVSQAGKSGWINAPLCGSDHVFCFANDMIFSPSGGQFWNFAVPARPPLPILAHGVWPCDVTAGCRCG
jgi:outer membrane protein assembly factor BamB